MGKVLITGSSGFLGSNMLPFIDKECILQYLTREPKTKDFQTECVNLRDSEEVWQLFARNKIDTVIHLASVVNGVGYNRAYPTNVLHSILNIDEIVISTAFAFDVQNFIYPGTISAYGCVHDNPLKEEEYLNGEPEDAVFGYAYAKRMGLVLLKAYNQQFGFNAHHPIITNLFGPHDNFFSTGRRLIPTILQKKYDNEPLTIFGTGNPVRDFLRADVAAEYIWSLTNREPKTIQSVNVSFGHGLSLKHMVGAIDYSHNTTYDASHADPIFRRVLDNRAISFWHKRFERSRAEFLGELKNYLNTTEEWYKKERRK